MTSLPTTITAIRFGYGLPSSGKKQSPDELLAALHDTAKNSAPSDYPARFRAFRSALKNRRELKKSAADMPEMPAELGAKKIRSLVRNSYTLDAHNKVIQAVVSPVPMYERLVSFWSNHFAVSAGKNRFLKIAAGPFENDAIRPHVMGRFADLLKAAEQHPAMLVYLDQNKSVGPNARAKARRSSGLNENLAREILELHTLGVAGGYDQQDVTELAKLLTGWTMANVTGAFKFRPRWAEPGFKTIMGSDYGRQKPRVADGEEFLEWVARQPATARHIATKLSRHFVADQPPESVIDRLAATYLQTDGDLAEVYRALLTSPESWSTLYSKVKSPFDFIVSGLRAVGVDRSDLSPVRSGRRLDGPNPLSVQALADLDQPIWHVPAPDGWPDDANSWITPQGLAGRLNWAIMATRLVDMAPMAFLEHTLADTASSRTRSTVSRASSPEEALALVLASPEFNRR